MSTEISRFTRDEISPDETLKAGEPISAIQDHPEFGLYHKRKFELKKALASGQSLSRDDFNIYAATVAQIKSIPPEKATQITDRLHEVYCRAPKQIRSAIESTVIASFTSGNKKLELVGIVDSEANGRIVPFPTEATVLSEERANA